MNKGKQLLIAVLCEFDQSHEIYRGIVKDSDTARQLMASTNVTKADIFSATLDGKSFFDYRETWDRIDALVKLLRERGEEVYPRDFTKVITGSKTVLQLCEDRNAIDKLFSPFIWKGRMEEMKELWFAVHQNDRRKNDFRVICRKVAEAEGREMREDKIERMGVRQADVRIALNTGDFDSIRSKMAAFGDYLRKEDVLAPAEDTGDSLLTPGMPWSHFEKIAAELGRNGEVFTRKDFLARYNNGTTILDRAVQLNELGKVFHPAVWAGRPHEMMELYEVVPADRKKDVNIQQVLSEVVDQAYAAKIKMDGNLTLSSLSRTFGRVADGRGGFSFRLLGMKSLWQKMDDVRAQLRLRGEKISLSDLRASAGGIEGETCLKAAARHGQFAQVLSILEESGESIGKDDLLYRGAADSQTLLEILVESEQLQLLMKPDLWAGRAQDLMDVWKHVPIAARDDAQFQKLQSEVNRLSLRKRFGNGGHHP